MRVNYFYTLAAGFVIVVLLSLFALNSHGTARETIISVLPPISDEPAFIIGTRVLDLDGNIRRIGDEDGVRPAVLVFLSSYCTISSRYLPELNALAETAQKANVDFYGVFSDPQLSWGDIRKIRDDYGLTFPILFDVSGDIASRLEPLVTPEAFVVGADDRIIYRGRIDNRFADIGKLRNKITKFELSETIHRVANRNG
jgi:peroxiredoxin